jgi:hypothetical protein
VRRARRSLHAICRVGQWLSNHLKFFLNTHFTPVFVGYSDRFIFGQPLRFPRCVVYCSSKENKMKNKIEITEAKLLLNNEVKVTALHSQFHGQTGVVKAIMADGRTLDIELMKARRAFVDVTSVGEIQEPVEFAKGEPDLGPIANSVVQSGL